MKPDSSFFPTVVYEVRPRISIVSSIYDTLKNEYNTTFAYSDETCVPIALAQFEGDEIFTKAVVVQVRDEEPQHEPFIGKLEIQDVMLYRDCSYNDNNVYLETLLRSKGLHVCTAEELAEYDIENHLYTSCPEDIYSIKELLEAVIGKKIVKLLIDQKGCDSRNYKIA